MLAYEDVPRPQPAENEVLVRVKAVGVNPVDWKIREGSLGPRSFPFITGVDFSGVIEGIGSATSMFRVGDEVFGRTASGSYAEFAVARVDQIAKKPSSITYIHAAALPVAAVTAWQALFDVGQLEANQTVFIHAATGGVGGFAVQFAKWKKAYVIGTASAENADFLEMLGADEVIDYRSEKFENETSNVDLVLDTIGGETQARSWGMLKRGGMLVSIVQPPSEETAAAHGVRCMFWVSEAKNDELVQIADLVADGKVKVYVEKTLPLSEARQAQELSQGGHTRGKIVLVVP